MSPSSKRSRPRGGRYWRSTAMQKRPVNLFIDSNSNDESHDESIIRPREIEMNSNEEFSDNESVEVLGADDEEVEESEDGSVTNDDEEDDISPNFGKDFCVIPSRAPTFKSPLPVIERRKLTLPTISKNTIEKEKKRYLNQLSQRAVDFRNHISATRTLWSEFKISSYNKFLSLYESGKRLKSHHIKFVKTNATKLRNLEEQNRKLQSTIKKKPKKLN